MSRVGIFVDVPSLWHCARRYGESSGLAKSLVDYAKLKRWLADGRDVFQITAYIWIRDGMDSFVKALRHLGYNVVLADHGKPLDSIVARDLMGACDSWDVAVVATGEGQYADVFQQLRDRGKQVEVHAFPIDCPIRDLAGKADRFRPLLDEVLRTRPEAQSNVGT